MRRGTSPEVEEEEFPSYKLLVSELRTIIPPSSSDPQEDTFYKFVLEFIGRVDDEYWAQFLYRLKIIFENRERWTFATPTRWSDGGLHVFSKDTANIMSVIVEDIDTADTSLISSTTSRTSMAVNGDNIFSTKEGFTGRRWREALVETVKYVWAEHRKDPTGLTCGKSRPKIEASLVGYMLTTEGAKALTDQEWPVYFCDDPTFRWNTLDKDPQTMEIFVSAIQAGTITNMHIDGPGSESLIWHVFGIKIWIVWDGTIENMHAHLMDGPLLGGDLKWCLENIRGAKLYFLHPGLNRPLIHVDGGFPHFVLSFTSAVHLSSLFYRHPKIEEAISQINQVQDDVRNDEYDEENLEIWHDHLVRVMEGYHRYFQELKEDNLVDASILEEYEKRLGDLPPHPKKKKKKGSRK